MKRNRLYTALFIVLLLLMTVFGKSVLPLLLIAAMVLLMAVSLFLAFLFSRHVTVNVAVETLSEKEKVLSGQITLKNDGPFPFPFFGTAVTFRNLLTGETEQKTVFHVLAAKGETRFPLSFSSRYCGKVRVAVDKLLFSDFFGVFSFSCPCEAAAESLILPEMFPVEITVVKSGVTEPECDKFSPYRSGDDPSETFAIRDYEPGDPLRSIHWKLTGKFDRLVIREASLPVNESVLLLFERMLPKEKASSAPAVRAALGEIVVSVSQKLTEMNIAHTLGWLSSAGGAFVGHRVDSEESFQLMLAEILSVSEMTGAENTIEGYIKSTLRGSYSNILYVSAVSPDNLFLLPKDVKKTVILCGDGDTQAALSDEAALYGVTPENYETALYPLLI